MPEKQAQGFGQSEEKQMFNLKDQNKNAASDEGQQIVLNIADAKNKKVLLHSHDDFAASGNPLVKGYRFVNDYLIDHSKIKVRVKATFFRLLSVMINSGLSLIKSLRTLGIQNEKTPKLSRALFDMANAIETGTSLSGAMAIYTDIFNPAEIGMVRASEASGQLNHSLKDIAEDEEKTASINSKVKGALIYPIVVLGLLTVVIFVMMVAVIPQLSKLFLETGHDLPLPTQILIAVSNFTSTYWYIVIGAFFAVIQGVLIWKKTRTGKYAWDLMKLKIPVFGSIMQKAVLSKFARALSGLLTSGVPIIKSIEIISDAVGNEVYKQRLFLTAEDMRRGIPLAENMANSDLFPTMFVNMVEVGEQTAQIEGVMLKISEFYEEDVNNSVNSLTKIMEPLIIAVIGITVGGLVAAVMLPIIQLTNITGGFN